MFSPFRLLRSDTGKWLVSPFVHTHSRVAHGESVSRSCVARIDESLDIRIIVFVRLEGEILRESGSRDLAELVLTLGEKWYIYMIPLESLRLMDGDQIDSCLLVADEMRGLYADIIFLDHGDEFDRVREHEIRLPFLVVADLIRELRYIAKRPRLELILL